MAARPRAPWQTKETLVAGCLVPGLMEALDPRGRPASRRLGCLSARSLPVSGVGRP
jgi:hypothetical protein